MVHIKNILKKERKQSPEVSGRDLPKARVLNTAPASSGDSGFIEIHPQTVTPLRIKSETQSHPLGLISWVKGRENSLIPEDKWIYLQD